VQGICPGFQGLAAGPVGSSNRWKPERRSRPSIGRTTPRRFAPRVLCRQAASEAVILPAIARATVITVAYGPPPRYHPHVTAPAKQVRAVPLTPAGTAAAEQPRSSPPTPPPSPAAPTQATPAKLSCPVLNPPALLCPAACFALLHGSRRRCGTRTASTLDAGLCAGSARRLTGFRGVEHPASQAGTLDSSASSATSTTPPTGGSSSPARNYIANRVTASPGRAARDLYQHAADFLRLPPNRRRRDRHSSAVNADALIAFAREGRSFHDLFTCQRFSLVRRSGILNLIGKW
jgi:hypothetical protein